MQIKLTQHMGILHALSNYVRETFNHGLSPSEVDWGDPKGEPTTHGPNYTSSGCMLIEVDWGFKAIVNCIINWGAHETHLIVHRTTRVHWGDHVPSLNPMDEYNISEFYWGAHDSIYFLYFVYIDLDAKPKDFFTQELWVELAKRHLPPMS